MANMHHCIGIMVFIIFSQVPSYDAVRMYGACAPREPEASTWPACNSERFPCLDGNCISRNFYCDGDKDCSDNSDELYCNRTEENTCPELFSMCGNSTKCIPNIWVCDGRADCPSEEDERSCTKEHLSKTVTTTVNQKAVLWMNKLIYPASVTRKWGPLVHKSAVALFLADPSFSQNRNSVRQQMAYELSIQLLSQLAQKGIKAISSSDLASFIHALLVTCLDPRDFHGFNLVQELTIRVNSQNYTTPYPLLALCNAGKRITKLDENKLNDAFWNSDREVWADTQALVVMALSCARNQPNSSIDSRMIHTLTMVLKQLQHRNGSVDNFYTTALVMQALYAAETSQDSANFDEIEALNQIIQNQQPDGSFGSLILTYYALPVLNCKSLVNISTSHCPSIQKAGTTLRDLMNRGGAKARVQYSLWIGMQRDMERTLTVRVPVNTSFYGIIELAAQVDSKYKFEYVVKNQKPYITAVSGILDDAESGNFWFPYILQNEEPSPLHNSTADITPQDGDHFVMWYRKTTRAD